MSEPTRVRTVIVDDEPPARDNLRSLLRRDEDVAIVGECGDGRSAVSLLLSQPVDLVFLDVQMPELSGFGVIEEVSPEAMPVVVFVTAYEEHALRAFDAQALDYLLKPFDDARFARALKRAKERIALARQVELANRIRALLEGERGAGDETRIVVRGGGRSVAVPLANVSWVESADDFVRIHTDDDVHVTRETMDRMEARLGSDRFLRVHRTAIVRIDRIMELDGRGSGVAVILRDGTRVPVSRSRRRLVESRLGS